MLLILIGFLIVLVLGTMIACRELFTEMWGVDRVKMGYVAVRPMTIAYRMASRRGMLSDNRLLSLVRQPQINFVNISYSLYRKGDSQFLCAGPKNEGSSVIYAVGVILCEDWKISKEDLKLVEELGYNIFTIPCISHAISAVYTVLNNESYSFAIKRVLTVMEQLINDHRLCAYPQVEIFNSRQVQIIIPLSRQIVYFVPEAVPPSPYNWYLNSIQPSHRNTNGMNS